jgi:hypothetical protein
VTKRWEFTVTGRGRFPLDMLRYDTCYPVGSDSVSRIEAKTIFERLSRANVEVRLRSDLKMPTVDRWKSFGWLVIDMAEVNDSTGRVKHLIPLN